MRHEEQQLIQVLQDVNKLIEAPESVAADLSSYLQALSEWNRQMNLVGKSSPETILNDLLGDALGLTTVLGDVSGPITDLGSGAGLPSIPLALLDREQDFFLVEAREKRIVFLRHIKRLLKMENLTIFHGRSDRLTPELCPFVIAQALAKPEEALGLMAPWCEAGGRLGLPLDIDQSLPKSLPPGFHFAEKRFYSNLLTGRRRLLYCVSRENF